nr:RHS repeat-associated core domain-containing protein [Pedobacter sp. ASV19]
MCIRDRGNVRVSFEDQGGVAVVRQENSYYPFGMVMPGSNIATPTTPNNNLYNGGSEWQNDFSNLPDYYNTYYRNYDAALGRFISVDPKAEGDLDQTPYHYALNNPLSYNDPLGDKPYPMRSISIFAGLESSYRGGNGGGGGYSVSSYLQQRYDKMMERQNSRGEWNEYLGQYMPTEKEVNDVIAKYGATVIKQGSKEMNAILSGNASFSYSNGYLYIHSTYTEPGFVLKGIDLMRIPAGNVGGDVPHPRGAIGGPVPLYGNFLGPGPDGPKGNPYQLIGYNGKVLKPIDMLDAAAQRHDYLYWKLKASGVSGAFLARQVYFADLQLARDAAEVMTRWDLGQNDAITGKPISSAEAAWAEGASLLFGILGTVKFSTYFY